jgi:hypothetical protein
MSFPQICTGIAGEDSDSEFDEPQGETPQRSSSYSMSDIEFIQHYFNIITQTSASFYSLLIFIMTIQSTDCCGVMPSSNIVVSSFGLGLGKKVSRDWNNRA